MPDPTDIQLPGLDFERNVAAWSPPRSPVPTKGGIIFPDKYKSIVVNIRPPKWRDSIFWIGQINNYVDAQFIADFVYYYIGHQCYHLQNVHFRYPPLKFTGSATALTSRKMCGDYVSSIARGPKFLPQRKEFNEKVKELALEEVKSVAVQRVLQQFRGANDVALAVGVEDNNEGVQFEQPVEVDDSKHLPLVLAIHEGLTGNVDGRNAHVLGFDMSDCGFHLRSALTPVEDPWVGGMLALFEDYDGTTEDDALDYCSVTRILDEDSRDCQLAYENFARNFFAMEDAAGCFDTGESSSDFPSRK